MIPDRWWRASTLNTKAAASHRSLFCATTEVVGFDIVILPDVMYKTGREIGTRSTRSDTVQAVPCVLFPSHAQSYAWEMALQNRKAEAVIVPSHNRHRLSKTTRQLARWVALGTDAAMT